MESSLPIESMLSGKRLEMARLQDTLVELIYSYVQPDAKMYGGTSIWRCYDGGRFSEDIDIYTGRGFSKKLELWLSKGGLQITWRDPEISSNVRISNGVAEVLLEAKVGDAESKLSQYRKIDGSAITIYTLTPTELLKRKIEAYSSRLYIRDLFDIFVLTNHLDKNDYSVSRPMKEFLKNIEKPVDERILASLVYKGPAKMGFKEIVKYLEGWVR